MAFAKDLRGQGSRLSTGQAEGGPHAPEEAAPPPTVGFRVNIDGLIQSPEVLGLVVGKEIQQAKKFPMNAPGRGDNRGEACSPTGRSTAMKVVNPGGIDA